MAREKELFRDNLERLDKVFPGRELLNQQEAAAILGMNVKTLKKHYLRKGECYISKARIASILS